MTIDIATHPEYGRLGNKIQNVDITIEFANGRTATIHVLDQVIDSGVFTGPIVLAPVVLVSDESHAGVARAQFDSQERI